MAEPHTSSDCHILFLRFSLVQFRESGAGEDDAQNQTRSEAAVPTPSQTVCNNRQYHSGGQKHHKIRIRDKSILSNMMFSEFMGKRDDVL